MTYNPPEGFTLDPPSGRYYRQDGIVNGKQWVTWFDASSGQYEQMSYPAQPTAQPAPVVQPTAMSPAPAPKPPAPVKAPVPAMVQSTAAPQKRGKGANVAIIALIVLVGAVFGGRILGLYPRSSLTDSVNSVSVLETQGTVDIERSSDTLTARAGMRLENLDTVQTASSSSAWLSLDDDKAVQLSELTALRIDQGRRGFDLTLVEGEIRAEINKPLTDNEDFTVQAGDLALAVQGTVFTVQYTSDIVWVAVESGQVAVLDKDGNELAVLGAGEGRVYGQKGGEFYEYEYTPSVKAPAASSPADLVGTWGRWIEDGSRYREWGFNDQGEYYEETADFNSDGTLAYWRIQAGTYQASESSIFLNCELVVYQEGSQRYSGPIQDSEITEYPYVIEGDNLHIGGTGDINNFHFDEYYKYYSPFVPSSPLEYWSFDHRNQEDHFSTVPLP